MKCDKKRGEEEKEGYLRHRGFLTIQKALVARKHHKIVYLGAPFAGRAIRSGGLVMPTLLCISVQKAYRRITIFSFHALAQFLALEG